MLCEPILVYGPTPAATCQTIWWLIDVLEPVSPEFSKYNPFIENAVLIDNFSLNMQMGFAGDYRPYFTIHEKDFSTLVNKNAPKMGLLLGVTNPFFASMCKHWPHVLSLQRSPASR